MEQGDWVHSEFLIILLKCDTPCPPQSLPVCRQCPLPLIPVSFKDVVSCFRRAKMDSEGQRKICTHHRPRKHYPSMLGRPLASLSPFPFSPSFSPSLPHRENPRPSSHLLHFLHAWGSTPSSSPALYRSSMGLLISPNHTPRPGAQQDGGIGFDLLSPPGVGPVSEDSLGLPHLDGSYPTDQ